MKMVNERTDLRVRRTQRLLWEALIALMDERDFEEISVTDICDRAMVHRTTFYKHYEDKYDLLMRGMHEMHRALAAEARLSPGAFPLEELPTGFVRVFRHVAEHERFYRLMLCGDGVGTFQSLMRAYLAECCESVLRKREQAGQEFSMPLPIIAQFCAGAVISTTAWWLENEMPYTPEQMAHYVLGLLTSGCHSFACF